MAHEARPAGRLQTGLTALSARTSKTGRDLLRSSTKFKGQKVHPAFSCEIKIDCRLSFCKRNRYTLLLPLFCRSDFQFCQCPTVQAVCHCYFPFCISSVGNLHFQRPFQGKIFVPYPGSRFNLMDKPFLPIAVYAGDRPLIFLVTAVRHAPFDGTAGKANFSYILLGGEDLRDVEFVSCIIQNAAFQNAILSGANFEGSDLSGSIFRGAVLQNGNLKNCNLTNCIFTDAILMNTILPDGSTFESNVEAYNHLRELNIKGLII